LEWRLRVATSEARDRGDVPRDDDAVKPDARDIIIEGLRMETDALRAALATTRDDRRRGE